MNPTRTRYGVFDDLVDQAEYAAHVKDWLSGLVADELWDRFQELIDRTDVEVLHALYGRRLEALGYPITETLKRLQSYEPNGDLEPEYDPADKR